MAVRLLFVSAISWSALSVANAQVPDAAQSDAVGIQDIIVTANKRSESANSVPISITALSGDQLTKLGVNDPSDLVKVTPGFTYAQSLFGPPVYTIRGIGFYDSSQGAKPSVSIYLDEVSVPFSVMAKGTTLDLERVEVLKGPQGILFGQNATGGAINYIAAKPTSTFKAGLDAGIESFGGYSAGGYVSGPLGPNLFARFAIKTEQGGGYQRSQTRPNDRNGDKDFTTARLLLNFEPTDSIRLVFGANGFIDKSETPAAQAILVSPLLPVPPGNPLLSVPLTSQNNRAADWTPGLPRSDNEFYQLSLRADIDLSDTITLTSLTAYSDYKADFTVDSDGLALNDVNYRTNADMSAFSQELRIAGKVGNATFILGGNYSDERTDQNDFNSIPDSSSRSSFAALGLPDFTIYSQSAKQKIITKAVFGNVDYDIGDIVTLHGGVRYTKTDIDFRGCSRDEDGNLALGVESIMNLLVRPSVPLPGNISIPRGSCVTINTDPTSPLFFTAAEVVSSLNEDNVSWRAGIDVKPSPGVLVYASASKGYKSGSFPIVSATDSRQFAPAKQESVMAYELGFKASVLDRTAQINGAIFHYDYRNKQFRGRRIGNPNIFGPLELLVNTPKSRITGGEIQVTITPTRGLNAMISGTYLDSKIKGPYIDSDPFGVFSDHGGEAFQYTPKYQILADLGYEWALSGSVTANLGASLEFRSDTNGAFGRPPIVDIKDYALVDLRGGVSFADGRYSVSAYVRNLFDTYYWNNASRVSDTFVRFAGRPRTFGARVSARF